MNEKHENSCCSQKATTARIHLTVRETEVFRRWIAKLRDLRAISRILARIQRLVEGNPGDMKPVGCGVWELRIDFDPGYRVYFTRRQGRLIILLAGGDKLSQAKDIEQAINLAAALEDFL